MKGMSRRVRIESGDARACNRAAVIGLTSALLVLFASGVMAQVLPGEVERGGIQSDLSTYRTLVLGYGRASNDALDRILLWDEKKLDRVLAVIDTERDEMRPWSTSRFKAAIMMHTDAALRVVDRSELDAALMHIETASQLMKKAGPQVRPYASRWYQAVARLFRDRNRISAAERFLQAGRERLPHDSTVLYESGALQELLATDNLLPTVIYLPDLSTPPPNAGIEVGSPAALTAGDVDDLKRHRIERLKRAAGWLRESLEADPANTLARLHLGRVQTLRNENEEALKLLREVAASEDPSTAYLAFLFIGALHEREERLHAAAQAYRAGIERFPLNQVGHIALSALLQRSGRGGESRDVLKHILGATVPSRREPWWTYLLEAPSVNSARLDLLRRESRQ